MYGAPLGSKTDRDHLMKDNLGRYCVKTFETVKGKKEKCGAAGLKPRGPLV